MNTPHSSLRWLLASGCAMLCWISAASAQTLLLEYTFNDSGTTTANTGSLGGSSSLVASDFATATDLHSASGTGVSTQLGDKALNLTLGSTGQGSGNTGPAATQSVSIGSLQSFTITGWYKASVLGGNARLFDAGSVVNGKGITVWMGANNSLNLTVNGNQSGVVTSSALNKTDTWVFYALTYDGSLSTNNVQLYVGGVSTAVTAVAATASSSAGIATNNTTAVVLGNQNLSTERPFDGLEDNIRLYGSASDSSGVLSMAAIENIRSLDAVPEPGIAVLCLAGGVLLGLRARRQYATIRA